MSELRVWHRPTLQLLDARATAQADIDAAHVDPNNEGDVPSWEDGGWSANETHTANGREHRQFDS